MCFTEEQKKIESDGKGKLVVKSDHKVVKADLFIKPHPNMFGQDDEFLKQAKFSLDQYSAKYNNDLKLTDADKKVLFNLCPWKEALISPLIAKPLSKAMLQCPL